MPPSASKVGGRIVRITAERSQDSGVLGALSQMGTEATRHAAPLPWAVAANLGCLQGGSKFC